MDFVLIVVCIFYSMLGFDIAYATEYYTCAGSELGGVFPARGLCRGRGDPSEDPIRSCWTLSPLYSCSKSVLGSVKGHDNASWDV